MGLLLKLYCVPEQVSYLLESVFQWLHSAEVQKVLSTITSQTLVTIYKTMDSIVIALSAVELWQFSL